jgi:hypothetical protein
VREQQLETADIPVGERARMYGPSQTGQIPWALVGREIQLIRAGGRTCDKCQRRPTRVATGDPMDLRGLCRECDEQRTLDRRFEINRIAGQAMRRRA